MIPDDIRKKLQNIIRGELQEGSTDSCTTIRNLLCQSFGANPTVKSEFESRAIIKEEQVTFLRSYAQKEGLWLKSLPLGCQYLTEGGEAKVYLSAYFLLGFTDVQQKLSAVVQQHFVEGEQASLDHIEGFLNFNGFIKTRRQDYYHSDLKLTLEDMHDENVIAKD